MSNFVWLKFNGQADIWEIVEQNSGTLTVVNHTFGTKERVKPGDAVGHWVWYINEEGQRVRGFCYQRRGRQTLVKIPICGFGKEVWVDDAVLLTFEESADFALEVMMRCTR